MKKKFATTGPLFIVIAALLWAADGVLRRSLYALPPLSIVFFEHLTGLLFLIPMIPASIKSFVTLKQRDKLWMLWVALFSSLLGTLWFTTALLSVNFIPFSVVFLLQKLQPIFVIMTAFVFLREKPGKGFLPYALLAFVAAYFVTFPGGVVNLSTGEGTLKAALYAVAAAFAWGSSTVFSRMMLTKLPDKQVTTLRFFFATIFAAVLLVWLGPAHTIFISLTGGQVVRFVAIALSTGMVALYIYYKGLARTPATVATFLELVFPVTAVLIDTYLYKTTLTMGQYIATVILLVAAYKLSTLPKEQVRFVTKKVRGNGRGKFLGFPTINMVIPKGLPAQDGIYATLITIGKKQYDGALHLGPIPTFGDEKRNLEVFLLDAKDKDVPNSMLEKEKITVEFVKWLRPVMNFGSEQDLIAQMTKDVEAVRAILR